MIVTETIFRMVWFVPLFFMWVSQLFTVFHVFSQFVRFHFKFLWVLVVFLMKLFITFPNALYAIRYF